MVNNIGKQKYGWTKWGGGLKGLVTNDIGGVWYCQCCGKSQCINLPTFKYEIHDREYIRICSGCWSIAKDIPNNLEKVKENLKR